MHGHRWEVVVCASSQELDEQGMAVDFGVLKGALDAILEELDHHCLNETSPFDTINPSSEHIARMVFQRMQAALPEIHFEHVEAWESPDAWVTFYGA